MFAPSPTNVVQIVPIWNIKLEWKQEHGKWYKVQIVPIWNIKEIFENVFYHHHTVQIVPIWNIKKGTA